MTGAAVAFLRAVNLGGRNKVPQRPLAERLAQETGAPVRHYLQSGNLVLAAPGAAPVAAPKLAALLRKIISADTGLDIAVIVRTAAQLAKILEACPWPGEDARRVHLSMWDGDHDAAKASAMAAADWSGDEIAFTDNKPGRNAGHNAWMRYATSFHEAKLGNHVIERRLGVVATARNLDTIRTVVEMANMAAGQ